MSCDECEKNSITNHELCMDCFEKEIIEAEKNGAIEELKKELDWILHAPFTNLNTKGMLEKRIRNRLKELMK